MVNQNLFASLKKLLRALLNTSQAETNRVNAESSQFAY